MSHKALARKHRPKSFGDVATQQHVSETLRSAVVTDRVGHAYLFCGPRGVGKTTLARVLAMALNCPDRTQEGEPCGVCESCMRIWGGHTALDVVEIDAASNRGVDDARDLRERAMYAPSAEGRTKVYIVDEAHMLTREAWNALLKILEEPPPRVIFVFATTEPQKIQQSAAPILSRCQRFDFRRISVGDIVDRLRDVLAEEETAASDDALRLIARKADGGMRDALSLLDQVLALTGDDVGVQSVRRVLGLVEEDRYLELFDVLREGRHEAVFRLVQDLVDEGYDLVEFFYGLVDILRALLRLRLSPDADVDLQEEVRRELLERAAAFDPGDLVRMLTSAADLETQGSLRRSPNPRLPIEMLLLRMSYLDRTVAIEELIRALGGAPSAGSGGAGSPGGGSGDSTESAPTGPSEPQRQITPAEAPVTRGAGGGAAESGGMPAGLEAQAVMPAWVKWLADGRWVPRGLGAFLRTADVRESEDGSLLVKPLPGPAVERLAETAVVEEIRSGLAHYLGYAPEVRVEPPREGPENTRRITRNEVREHTLQALFRQEPRLERAVEELDLELME